MISIYLNDEVQEVEATLSLQDLLMQNQYRDQHFAVAINKQLIPRMLYSSTLFNPNDNVDVIVPMQGG
ncbi:MAG: sulfur carrier protein ThiS [Legionellales bacterium]